MGGNPLANLAALGLGGLTGTGGGGSMNASGNTSVWKFLEKFIDYKVIWMVTDCSFSSAGGQSTAFGRRRWNSFWCSSTIARDGGPQWTHRMHHRQRGHQNCRNSVNTSLIAYFCLSLVVEKSMMPRGNCLYLHGFSDLCVCFFSTPSAFIFN